MANHFHQRDTRAFACILRHTPALVPPPTTPSRGSAPHLSILMVNKDIPSAVVLQIGDLQAVGDAYFCRLESGINSIDLHYRFGLSGLQKGKTFLEERGIVSALLEKKELIDR